MLTGQIDNGNDCKELADAYYRKILLTHFVVSLDIPLASIPRRSWNWQWTLPQGAAQTVCSEVDGSTFGCGITALQTIRKIELQVAHVWTRPIFPVLVLCS